MHKYTECDCDIERSLDALHRNADNTGGNPFEGFCAKSQFFGAEQHNALFGKRKRGNRSTAGLKRKDGKSVR